MKKLTTIALAGLMSTSLFASTESEDFLKLGDNLAKYLASEMPFINTLGAPEFQAQSPKLITIGVAGGVGFLGAPAAGEIIDGLQKTVSTDKLPIGDGVVPMMYSPTILGRVNIPGLPVDLSAKIGFPVNLEMQGISFRNTSFGGEVSYTLFQIVALPTLTVGAGFDFMAGHLAFSDKKDYGDIYGDYTMTTEWSMLNYQANLLASYQIPLIPLSFVAGLEGYLATGTAQTKLKGNIGADAPGTPIGNLTGKEQNPEGFEAKYSVGAYFVLPFVAIGGTFDQALTGDAMAVTLSAHLAF